VSEVWEGVGRSSHVFVAVRPPVRARKIASSGVGKPGPSTAG